MTTIKPKNQTMKTAQLKILSRKDLTTKKYRVDRIPLGREAPGGLYADTAAEAIRRGLERCTITCGVLMTDEIMWHNARGRESRRVSRILIDTRIIDRDQLGDIRNLVSELRDVGVAVQLFAGGSLHAHQSPRTPKIASPQSS